MAVFIVTSLLLLLTALAIAYPDYWTRIDNVDATCSTETLERKCKPGTDLYGAPLINPVGIWPQLGGRNCIRIRLQCSKTAVLLQKLNCCHNRTLPDELDYALINATWEFDQQLKTFFLRSCQTLKNGTLVHGMIVVAEETAEPKSESCAVFELVRFARVYSNNTVVTSGFQNIFIKGIGIVRGKSRKSQERSAKVDNFGDRYIWTFVWAGIGVIGVGLIVLYNCLVNVSQD